MADPTVALVSELLYALGPTAVAVMAGVRFRQQPQEWAVEGGEKPGEAALQRLHVAHEAWTTLAESHGAQTARLWFIGDNPRFDASPLMAIRNDHADVVAAAQEFAMSEGSW